MTVVAARELRNNTRAVLDRVEAGEDVTITVDGRPVAVLRPVPRKRRSMPKAEFLARFGDRPADPAFFDLLRTIYGGETTDDTPLR